MQTMLYVVYVLKKSHRHWPAFPFQDLPFISMLKGNQEVASWGEKVNLIPTKPSQNHQKREKKMGDKARQIVGF